MKFKRSIYPLIENPALPYFKGLSPTDAVPRIVDGSNVMTSWRKYIERRWGTATYTTDDYSTDTIRRFFDWQRWNGDRYIMLNEIEGSASKVYKQKVGTDTTFVLIHTDSSSTEPFDFVVTNNWLFFGNGTDMQKYDGTTVYNWGVTAPATACTATPDAGGSGVTLVVGRKYAYAYGNSTSGYLSDLAPLSASTGAVSTDSEIDLAGADTTDAYIDKIHIYATEDGGFVLRELSDSPIANPGTGAGWTHSDTDADTELKTQKAPKRSINAKPTAGKGMEFYAGRIWYFINSKLYYTGFEEVTNGHAPESVPTSNVRDMGREITGLKAVGSGVDSTLLIFTVRGTFTVRGDSRATFTWGVLSGRHGLRNRATLTVDSDIVAWLDISNTLHVTDGVAKPREFGLPIRDDIVSINHTTASMTIHRDGRVNWIVLADGTNGKLYVFDMDLEQWMPPWSLSGLETVYSAETANSTWTLLIGQSGKPIKFDSTLHQDQGVSFTAEVKYSSIEVAAPGPEEVSDLEYVGLERNSVSPSAVLYLANDDTSTGSYSSIAATEVEDPAYHESGSSGDLVEKWHYVGEKIARRVSVDVQWAAANSKFKLYTIYVKASKFGQR